MSEIKSTVYDLTDEEEAAIQRGIALDPENPEWTEEDFRRARPLRELLPDLADAIDREIARRGRPVLAEPKQPVTLRLDRDVVEAFKAGGAGWQSRMNAALRAAAGLKPSA